MTVMRSIWINDNVEPFEEKASEEIEKKHIELFKDQLANEIDSCLSMDLNESIDDSKAKIERKKIILFLKGIVYFNFMLKNFLLKP